MSNSTPDEHDNTFWIRSEPTLDGTAYVVTLSISQDYAVTLTPTRATAYATTLLGAVAEAEYDAAVLAQVRKRLELDDQNAFIVVNEMRADRPRREAAGLVFQPGVSQRASHPFITVIRDGEPIGQLETPAARRHALHVLEAPAVADLDALYVRTLRILARVPDGTARQAVADIVHHRAQWAVEN